MLVIVMGVCGSGKSTIGGMLAEATGYDFIDGDGLHPPENVKKMAAGHPLVDEDRWPWLRAIGKKLAEADDGRIIACSALKRAYRSLIAETAGQPVLFIHLNGTEPVLADRMQAREGHFMPPALLRSQLETLETPSLDEFAVILDGDQPIEAVFQSALESVQSAFTPRTEA